MNKKDENIIIDTIHEQILTKMKKLGFIEIEASGRHVHLSQEHIDALFGKDYNLTKLKDLSQPGQFVCKERISIAGPKGELKNVVILGPARNVTQIEISKTDSRILGLEVPVRESGLIDGTPGIQIMAGENTVALNQGTIIADKHIHMSTKDAADLALKNGDRVDVEVETNRPIIFKRVKIRVSDDFETFMHIDYDEANACDVTGRTFGRIVKKYDN